LGGANGAPRWLSASRRRVPWNPGT